MGGPDAKLACSARLPGLLAVFIAVVAVAGAQMPTVPDSSPPELTVDQAIEQALAKNASYRSAQLDTRYQEKTLAANRTRLYPSLQTLAIGGQLLTKPSVTFAAGSLGNFPSTGPIPATDQKITIPRRFAVLATASASQPLTTLYRIRLSLKSLEMNVEGTREDERKSRNDTVDQVRRAYYDIVKAQSQFDSAAASLPFYQESKRLADQRYRQETILESDLLRADEQLVKALNREGEAEDQIGNAREKLNDLIGRDIHTRFRVTGVAEIADYGETEEDLERRALENRPDIKKSRLQVKAAEYDRRAKRAEYIPDVSLSVNYLTTTNLENALPSGITTAGATLTWEPWDWGRKRREYEGKLIQEQKAKVQAEETERSALLEVRSTWRQLQQARRQLNASAAAQRSARANLREKQTQVKVEQALMRDLFSAQSDLASADSQYQQALTSFWSARADLKKATGTE